MNYQAKIEELESRISELEKAIRIITSSNRNTQLSELLNNASTVYSYDFTKNLTLSPWSLSGAVEISHNKGFTFEGIKEKHKCGEGFDPIFQSPELNLDSNKARVLRVWFGSYPKFDTQQNGFKVYFKTQSENYYSESKSIWGKYTPNDRCFVGFVMKQHPLYNGKITGIRLDVFEGPGKIRIDKIEITDDPTTVKEPTSKVIYSADFTEENGFENSGFQVECGKITCTEKCVEFEATPVERFKEAFDPRLNNDEIVLDINNVRYIKLRCKCQNTSNSPYAQIYFKTAEHNEYSQNKLVRQSYPTVGQFCDMFFDMKENSFWNGTLTGIRLDLLETCGIMSIQSIEMYNETPQSSVGGWVNSIEERLSQIEDIEYFVQNAVYDAVECEIYDIVERVKSELE